MFKKLLKLSAFAGALGAAFRVGRKTAPPTYRSFRSFGKGRK